MRLAKLGNSEFTLVSTEDITESAEVTDKPIEMGSNISDHVKQEALQISIEGIMNGGEAKSRFDKIRRHKNEGTPMYYQGVESHKNMVVLNIEINHSVAIKNGLAFTMSLKQITVSTAKRVHIGRKSVSSPNKVGKPMKAKGRGRSYMLYLDKGSDVKELQVKLNKLGYGLATDSSYGPATRRAVTNFQKKYKLKVDGSAGVQVFAELEKQLQNKQSKKKVGSKVSSKSNKGRQQTKK